MGNQILEFAINRYKEKLKNIYIILLIKKESKNHYYLY